jgi:hypothetical protein
MGVPSDKRRGLEGLVKYLPYLEELTAERVCHWMTETDENGVEQTYPTYEDTFIEFVDHAYNEGLLEIEYIKIISEKAEPGLEIEALIYGVDSADYEFTMALLTFLVVQENYNPGVWATAVSQNLFTPIIRHVADLLDED